MPKVVFEERIFRLARHTLWKYLSTVGNSGTFLDLQLIGVPAEAENQNKDYLHDRISLSNSNCAFG